MKIEIKEKMYSEIQKYCEINNIDDITKFINKILNQGFSAEKWGVPTNSKSKVVEKIVEKIIISAITQEPQKIEIKEKKDIEFPIDNEDFYGEKKFRQIK